MKHNIMEISNNKIKEMEHNTDYDKNEISSQTMQAYSAPNKKEDKHMEE